MQADMSKVHKWNAADTVTILRMVGTLCLAFVEPETLWFFAVYTITGLTDVLDGWRAPLPWKNWRSICVRSTIVLM